jgi:hypothetical protein
MGGCSLRRFLSIVVGCCALARGAQSQPVKRLYVEPFGAKKGSGELREDVVAQLKKLGLISVVDTPSNADAILSGEGEIWVKGYISLNPRSGRLPSDGTPVYSGYLSIELKDTKGDTLWSYLATPGSGSGGDVAAQISKRAVSHLAEELAKPQQRNP